MVRVGLNQLRLPHPIRGTAACAGVVASFLWVTQAHAYCLEVTKPAPANYDPTVSGCFQNDPITNLPLPTLFWKNPCVGYSIQKGASSQISLADATRVASQAFAAWSTAACANGSPSITATALSPVDCAAVPSQEHNNVIIFRDNGWPYTDSSNTLGYTTLTVNTCTGEILGADIEINSTDYKIFASGTPDAGGYDLATILTHEAGHFLGLAHTAEKSAVMFASYHAGSTALALDDIGGICSIYPSDGTRNTSLGSMPSTSVCDPSPRLGFLNECGSRQGSIVTCGPAPDAGSSGGGSDDAGGDTADAGNPCVSPSSCAVGHARTSGSAGLGALGLVAFAGLARRARRARG